MKILFVDPKSSTPYDSQIMLREGIGGTEASLVRVAEGLAPYHTVTVEQLGRSTPATCNGVLYCPLDTMQQLAEPVDVVIILRKHRLATHYKRAHPKAKLLLWVCNWQRPEAALKQMWLRRTQARIVTLSEAHRNQTDSVVNGWLARALGAALSSGGPVPIDRIYYPIDEKLAPDNTPVNRNRLLFLSTANKGLSQVLQTFSHVRNAIPDMELLIAGNSRDAMRRTKGITDELLNQDGVRVLGRLPQAEITRHSRAALCVFYPQNIHAETFGLIFAEANAIGTPVLAHPFGSAPEVLYSPEELVNADDLPTIIARLKKWRDHGRPNVMLRPQFRENLIIKEWLSYLDRLQTGQLGN